MARTVDRKLMRNSTYHIKSASTYSRSAFGLFVQPSLLEAQTSGAPHNGTITSFRAAQSIVPHLGPMQARVLSFIEDNGPATEEEISLGTGMRLQSVCARVNELVHQKHQLRDTGDKRQTTSRRWAVVWGIELSPATGLDHVEAAHRNRLAHQEGEEAGVIE
jgi:hypothetical protein